MKVKAGKEALCHPHTNIPLTHFEWKREITFPEHKLTAHCPNYLGCGRFLELVRLGDGELRLHCYLCRDYYKLEDGV